MLTEELRQEHGVRPLPPEFEGFALRRIPEGVYGFSYSPVQEVPLFGTQRLQSFEIHYLKGGETHIVGYVTPEEAKEIRAGGTFLKCKVYPQAYEEATELVSVPAS